MIIFTPQMLKDNIAQIISQKVGDRVLTKELVELFAYDLETWVGLLHKQFPRIEKEELTLKLLELVENKDFVPYEHGFSLNWEKHEKLLREFL